MTVSRQTLDHTNHIETPREKISVILLVGAGHSGSTLIDLVLGSHGRVFGAGELSYYTRLIYQHSPCGCGKELNTCSFWNTVFKPIQLSALPLVYQRTQDFLLNTSVYYGRGAQRVDATQYTHEIYRVYKNILEQSGAAVVFDSSKSPHRANLLVASGFFAVTIVHLIRDGRGVVYSNKKLGRSVMRSAIHWIVVNIQAELVKYRNQKRGGKSITILYRDFASDPDCVSQYILQSQGFEAESRMRDFRGEANHLIGGNGRVRDGRTNTIRRDTSWKKGLSRRDRLACFVILGPMNWFYDILKKGYTCE